MRFTSATLRTALRSGVAYARGRLGAASKGLGGRMTWACSGLRAVAAALVATWPFRDFRATPLIVSGLAVAGSLWLASDWRDVPGDWREFARGNRPLAHVASWHYQLDKPDLDKLAASAADMLVIDYAKNSGRNPLTREEVARLQVHPNGRKRTVISYLSIGEAEEFRYYWDDAWKAKKPSWLERENCAWPRAWMVRYWQDGWRSIIYKAPDSYLKRIVDAGFDGVYLDRIDMYEHIGQHATARDAMIAFVIELAAAARAMKPGFILIAQNAEDLLAERRYRRVIDAVAKEELLYSRVATGELNRPGDVEWSLARLNRLRWEWKPVFPVEYLLTADAIGKARTEVERLGFVGVYPNRALDGGDPTEPQTLAADAGTPEFIKDKCPPGSAW